MCCRFQNGVIPFFVIVWFFLCGLFLWYAEHDLRTVKIYSIGSDHEERSDGFSFDPGSISNATSPVDFLDMDCAFPLTNNRFHRQLISDPKTFCSNRKFISVEFDCGRFGHTLSLTYMLYVSGRMLQARATENGCSDVHVPVIARCHHCVLCSLFLLPKDTFVVRDYLEDHCPDIEWKTVAFSSLNSTNITELMNSNVELSLWPIPRMHIQSNKDIIKKFFKVQPQFIRFAEEILDPIKTTHCHKCQLVFVHIRLTDFGSRLKKWKVPPIKGRDVDKAISTFKSTVPNALFLVITDDKEWVIENLTKRPDVILFENQNITSRVSFALMTLCDGAILTLGSFGQWAALVGQANGKMKKVIRMVPKRASKAALGYLVQDYDEPKPPVEYFFN